MSIEIFKIETIELPDKRIMEIYPLDTDDMDLLLEFMELSKKADMLKLKEAKKRKRTSAAEQKEVTDSLKFTFNDLVPIADKIIDKGTRIQGEFTEVPLTEIIDGEEVISTTKQPVPFPKEYRNISNRIQLTKKIFDISMGDINSVVEDPNFQAPANKLNEWFGLG